MAFRAGKILTVLLVPAAVYGVAKGVMYFNAKQAVDDLVEAARGQVEIHYADISTELTGAVTVKGITMSPYGDSEYVSIAAVRVSSDDPLVFIKSAKWVPGENTPPPTLSLQVTGVEVPIGLAERNMPSSQPSADPIMPSEDGTPASICADGMDIDPHLLSAMGFAEMTMDLDAKYVLNEEQRTLDVSLNSDLHDVQNFHVSATFTDVDVQALSQGVAPSFNLGSFTFATTVSPQFGHRALKTCSAGTEQTVQEWSGMLADIDEQRMQMAGLALGDGLKGALRSFYKDWGEIEVSAHPQKPVGVLSLAFLPPEQLMQALALEVRLNGQQVTDTSFTWAQPDTQQLGALFGAQPSARQTEQVAEARPRRILVRREYEPVPVARISEFVDHQVQIKPRGQPLREGKLKRVRDAAAEIEQTLHGGKFTVYVPLSDIDSIQALVQREVKPVQ